MNRRGKKGESKIYIVIKLLMRRQRRDKCSKKASLQNQKQQITKKETEKSLLLRDDSS